MSKKSKVTALFIPDTHFPFEKVGTFEVLKEAKKLYEPDVVYHVGDLVDQHGLGRWLAHPDAHSNMDELEGAKDCVKRLQAIFPNLNICLGNHDLRALKKIMNTGIPSVFVRSLHEVMGMPKTWKFSEFFQFDKIRIFHGDNFTGKNAALDAAIRYRQSCVMGHVHAFAGIHYTQGPSDRLFGMNVGALVNTSALAFHYAREYTNKPVQGYGVLINGVPHFIPVD